MASRVNIMTGNFEFPHSVAVGMIRDALKQHGVADNTVVIFTSDNGFLCGSHGYGSKVLPYEESARVPMIMFDPRHPNSGKKLRCGALTGNVDFAPTLLELAGVALPAGNCRGITTDSWPGGSVRPSRSTTTSASASFSTDPWRGTQNPGRKRRGVGSST
jgi:arylsulfatase A-like enzyme